MSHDGGRPCFGPPRRVWHRAIVGLLCVILMALATVFPLASVAGAHIALDSSFPVDGATVGSPLDRVVLTFTGPAEPVGEGFVIFDPAGVVRAPDVSDSTDGVTWRLSFDEPIEPGDVGVRWTVANADGHPIDGSFSFTVLPPEPTSTTTTTVEPTTTTAESTTTTLGPTTSTTSASSAVSSVTAGSVDAAPSTSAPASAGTTGDDEAAGVASAASAGSVELDDFLAGRSAAAPFSRPLGWLARFAALAGSLFVVGGLACAAWVVRGGRADLGALLSWVRTAGLVIFAGAAIDFVGSIAAIEGAWSAITSGSTFSDAVSSSRGVAVVLRMVGGLLVAVGLRSARSDHDARARTGWRPGPNSLLGLTGVAALLGSFLFDGHTVSEGPRVVTAAVDIVHVVSAGIWGGGVLCLVLLLVRSRRDSSEISATDLGVRFSVIASVAVVAAGIAGSVLAIIVLETPSALWSSPWGRIVIAKALLVAVAGGLGAYNHFVMVPAMQRERDGQGGTGADAEHRFRSIMAAEGLVLVCVVAATAFLVNATPI